MHRYINYYTLHIYIFIMIFQNNIPLTDPNTNEMVNLEV